jgi:hypothetical protein
MVASPRNHKNIPARLTPSKTCSAFVAARPPRLATICIWNSSIRFEVPSFSGQASLPRRSCSSTVNRSGKLTLTTTDSNTWGGPSGHTYTFTRQPNGTTDIDVVVVRDGKNLKGRLLGFVLGTHRQARFGKSV